MSSPTIDERIGLWKRAYDVVSAELTSEYSRTVLETLKTRNPEDDEGPAEYMQNQLAAAQRVASMVSANNRSAGLIAAALVPGVRITVEYPE